MSVYRASEQIVELIRKALSQGGTFEGAVGQAAEIDVTDIQPLIQSAVDTSLATYFMEEFWERKLLRDIAPGNFFVFRNYPYYMIGPDESSNLSQKPMIVDLFMLGGPVRCKLKSDEEALEIRVPAPVRETLYERAR